MGLHKTGTSTIQNVLHANREFLLEQEGVLYPSLAPNLSTPLLTVFKNDPQNQAANKMAGLTSEQIEARGNKYLNSLDTEILSSKWETLLLSAEGISSMREHEVAKLREWGDKYSSEWLVLICVRHPVDWTCSVVQERLKQGDTLRQLYEEPPRVRYCQKISNAISVFGQENVRVFDFDTAIKDDGGIVGAFAAQAELSAPSRDLLVSRAQEVRANESSSLEAVHIHDALNRQRPMFEDGVRVPSRPGPGQEVPYLKRIKGQRFDVPDYVKEKIRSRSREDVAWLNETFGLDLYGDVMDEETFAERYEKSFEALSDPAIESIAEVLGELLTKTTFHSTLEEGREALAQGKLKRAENMLRRAARLEPDASQPDKLLEEVIAKQSGESTDTELSDSDRSCEGERLGNERWLPPKVRDMLAQLKRKATRAVRTK